MLWKVGLKEQRERKNKSKVTQELVEKKRVKFSRITNKKRKVKKNRNKQEKKEGKRVTYTNEERRENSKVKEYEKLGEIK